MPRPQRKEAIRAREGELQLGERLKTEIVIGVLVFFFFSIGCVNGGSRSQNAAAGSTPRLALTAQRRSVLDTQHRPVVVRAARLVGYGLRRRILPSCIVQARNDPNNAHHPNHQPRHTTQRRPNTFKRRKGNGPLAARHLVGRGRRAAAGDGAAARGQRQRPGRHRTRVGGRAEIGGAGLCARGAAAVPGWGGYV